MMESCFRSSETRGQVGNISSEVAAEPKGTVLAFELIHIKSPTEDFLQGSLASSRTS